MFLEAICILFGVCVGYGVRELLLCFNMWSYELSTTKVIANLANDLYDAHGSPDYSVKVIEFDKRIELICESAFDLGLIYLCYAKRDDFNNLTNKEAIEVIKQSMHTRIQEVITESKKQL